LWHAHQRRHLKRDGGSVKYKFYIFLPNKSHQIHIYESEQAAVVVIRGRGPGRSISKVFRVRLFAAAKASKFSRPAAAPGQNANARVQAKPRYKPGKAPRQLRATFRFFPWHAPPPGLCQHAVAPPAPAIFNHTHAVRSRTARGLTLFYAT